MPVSIPILCMAAIAATLAAGPAAPGDDAVADPRRSPIVRAAEAASPSVVNISTEQKIENPFHGSRMDRFFQEMLERSLPGLDAAAPPPDEYVRNSLGSGVIIDPRGYILTNEHLLWRASRVHVTLADRRRFEAEVVGVDPRSDLAVLSIHTQESLPAIQLPQVGDLLIGETVIAIGNPYGLSNTVTTGVVSAVGRSIKLGDRVYSDFIQTDASLNPGSSGGALVNILGEMIGVSTAIMGEGKGISFAIPAGRARKVFEDLVTWGEVRVAWLGIDVRDLTDREYAGIFDAQEERNASGAVSVPAPGVTIRRIYAGSPAQAAGLAVGDIVTDLGDQHVSSRTDFETVLSRHKAGDTVPIAYRHGETRRQVDLPSTEFPESLSEDYLADQLGVEVSDISEELRRSYPTLPSDGVIVTRVRHRSRAYFSGLERGDVLRGISDRPVRDMASLVQAVPRMVGRSAVLLKVVRGPYQYNVTIELS